jgi:hypothetical protein
MKAESSSPFILGFFIVTVSAFNGHIMSCGDSCMAEMREQFEHCMYVQEETANLTA